ncbi:MAG: MBOAT family protein [Candidatus Melainabacteria bacterium]|nr:MBOAT family protein [Candidatus Melainabacteria bacterium]
MLFNSFDYLIFLPLVVLAYWLCPWRLRIGLLIAASYYFYMHSFKIYGLLLLGLTVANYLLGLGLAQAKESYRRLVLIAGIAFNLGMLALFKYTNLLLDTLNKGLDTLGAGLHLQSVHTTGIADLPIILPLGISFFVFEFIHYLTDVFKGSAPVKNPLRFALFASFFPSQIAGPIKRYQDFDKQLDKPAAIKSDDIYSGLWLISRGLFKKVALGDNLAPVVQAGFANPAQLGTGEAWLAVLAFAFQIYYDFSGYTDMGRGSAMLFGFSLPENFNMPYLARSLKDFWHRWHISLSTWLRDYLYIPLGGSRRGELGTLANLFTTMLLGGLWHGASWTFLLWGAFHGAGLGLNRIYEGFLNKPENAALKKAGETWLGQALAYVVTMVTVLVGWVLFYAHNLPQALGVLKAMFLPQAASADCMVKHLTVQSTLLPAAALYGTAMLVYWGVKKAPALPSPAFLPPRVVAHSCALLALFIITIELAPRLASPFIYFQF